MRKKLSSNTVKIIILLILWGVMILIEIFRYSECMELFGKALYCLFR